MVIINAKVIIIDKNNTRAEAIDENIPPTHCITDKRFTEKRIGIERCKGSYVRRRQLDTGAKSAFRTDYSVEPLDPQESSYAAVTRKDRTGESGDGWFLDQKLTMEEGIKLYTQGGLHHCRREGRLRTNGLTGIPSSIIRDLQDDLRGGDLPIAPKILF
jgi:hypothetical protein